MKEMRDINGLWLILGFFLGLLSRASTHETAWAFCIIPVAALIVIILLIRANEK